MTTAEKTFNTKKETIMLDTYATLETSNGTLTFKVIETAAGKYKGQITHDLHKHPRFNGKVLKRESGKTWGAKGWAEKWLQKEYDNQRSISG